MSVGVEFLTGRFPGSLEDFRPVPLYCSDEPGHFLLPQALSSFLEMHEASKADNVDLLIISSLRSFERQKTIWENKWDGRTPTQGRNIKETFPDPAERAKAILKFSAMPATSRHHWGTDFDINAVEDEYFLKGRGKEEYLWLKLNAGKFGFGQPYSIKNSERPRGYEEEKWHWSYLPLSKLFLEEYIDTVDYKMIIGFDGSETAEELNVIRDYVYGIAGDCI